MRTARSTSRSPSATVIDRWGTKSPLGRPVIDPRASTEYTNVATKTPSVIWFPVSRMKCRIMRGPNCCDASVSARMVIEKTTPTVVMMAAAMAIKTCRPASALPVLTHQVSLPWWVRTGSADAGRQVLIAIAAAIITTVGVVFSITILALTLASQQFGPRMMRHFIRDTGNQMTLGVFVATFVYSVLALGSITGLPSGDFVPHLSITVAEGLLLVDLAVLIYFIHHVAKSIQLPEVIAGIARDLDRTIDAEFPERAEASRGHDAVAPVPIDEATERLQQPGAVIAARHSGYLQFVGYAQLVEIAESSDAIIRLAHRPGHFVVAHRPLATVWPPEAAGRVATALDKGHVTGPHRTLTQDPVFAIDQLVEIAIRALSPAVNDTFTALTCIDWLSAGLSEISSRILEEGVYRGRSCLLYTSPSP